MFGVLCCFVGFFWLLMVEAGCFVRWFGVCFDDFWCLWFLVLGLVLLVGGVVWGVGLLCVSVFVWGFGFGLVLFLWTVVV
ncbi:hypothetical protein [Pseudomonas syringae group genomosp. 7]|uniref:hypothetical protein n=1 Tax=Pseudomonas syringae group genomosp. 7 TaxID=251699 RepID=UPI0037704519